LHLCIDSKLTVWYTQIVGKMLFVTDGISGLPQGSKTAI